MRVTRREMLGILGAVSAGGCCARYPRPTRFGAPEAPVVAFAEPRRPTTAHGLTGPVIDVHAHFFNASDVPVRGFLSECIGHSAPPPLRRLIELAAPLADVFAALAPTAAEELRHLRAFDRDGRLMSPAEKTRQFDALIARERTESAGRVAEAIRGSDLERELTRMKATGAARAAGASLSAREIHDIVESNRLPSPPSPRFASYSRDESFAAVADGFIGFLTYMLSLRARNLEEHHSAFRAHSNAFGIDVVLGALVDFDYWIDCAPRSAHEDQIEVHARLASQRPEYFVPLVGYNPWTDILRQGAGLERVIDAVEQRKFAGVKIYPPMGFMPAGNAIDPPETPKERPDLDKLDKVLKKFFDTCARIGAPVLAHAARSNGRDYVHDEFGGPKGWRTLLDKYMDDSSPTIDLGHFGGGAGSTWTQDFAVLMHDKPAARLYADLGYWEELMCPLTPDDPCLCARQRLEPR